jgi:drug/metabolite transporter (DMT)-like permease
MAAIFLCDFKPEKKADGATPAFAWVLPLCVFLGTGITDILTQWLNQEMVPESSSGWMIMVVFMSAAATALVLLVFRRPFKIKRNSIFTGFLLGLPNFISYKSILAALSSFHHKGDVVFPLANLGVIVCTSLLAALIFKDRLSRLNLIGLVLALFSLSLFFRMP